MIKNNGCCDLEYAQRLKELKVKQESLWYHIHFCQSHGMIPDGEISGKKRADSWNPEFVYSAFTVAELGEMLPHHFKSYWIDNNNHIWACYDGRIMGAVSPSFIASGDTEANARAKMLIWLIENKNLEVDK